MQGESAIHSGEILDVRRTTEGRMNANKDQQTNKLTAIDRTLRVLLDTVSKLQDKVNGHSLYYESMNKENISSDNVRVQRDTTMQVVGSHKQARSANEVMNRLYKRPSGSRDGGKIPNTPKSCYSYF